jgi:hypothetical protein
MQQDVDTRYQLVISNPGVLCRISLTKVWLMIARFMVVWPQKLAGFP